MVTTISPLPESDLVTSTLRAAIRELRPDLDVHEINENSPLLEDGLGLDSIAIVELIGVLEDRLGFMFEDTDLRSRTFKSVATLAEVVLERMQKDGATPPE